MKDYIQRKVAEFKEIQKESFMTATAKPLLLQPEAVVWYEEILIETIAQALAEERERVVGILSAENYKLEEWYSSSERPDTLTHFEANQRNMKTRNEIEQLISFPLDKPLPEKE